MIPGRLVQEATLLSLIIIFDIAVEDCRILTDVTCGLVSSRLLTDLADASQRAFELPAITVDILCVSSFLVHHHMSCAPTAQSLVVPRRFAASSSKGFYEHVAVPAIIQKTTTT